MSLNCPGEAFPIRYSCVSHHNGVLNPSRDGSSAELLVPVVILNWSKKPALPNLWFVISETELSSIKRSHLAVKNTILVPS